MLMLPLSWLHELRELLRQDRITSLQVTLSLCANQNARLPKALDRGIPASFYNQPQQLSYQPVITADIGRAGWPALVQIRAINVPVGFYCSRNVRVVFYLTMSEIQPQCPLSNFLKGQCRLSQITPSTPLILPTTEAVNEWSLILASQGLSTRWQRPWQTGLARTLFETGGINY